MKDKLNISQNKLFNKVDEYMKSYDFSNKSIKNLEKVLKKEFRIENEVKNEKNTITDDLLKIEKEKKILAQKVIE